MYPRIRPIALIFRYSFTSSPTSKLSDPTYVQLSIHPTSIQFMLFCPKSKKRVPNLKIIISLKWPPPRIIKIRTWTHTSHNALQYFPLLIHAFSYTWARCYLIVRGLMSASPPKCAVHTHPHHPLVDNSLSENLHQPHYLLPWFVYSSEQIVS